MVPLLLPALLSARGSVRGFDVPALKGFCIKCACKVSHESLRDHAERMHFSGTDGAVFEAYRELIEEVASETYDAEGPFDAAEFSSPPRRSHG
jgi:hypothetical protein